MFSIQSTRVSQCPEKVFCESNLLNALIWRHNAFIRVFVFTGLVDCMGWVWDGKFPLEILWKHIFYEHRSAVLIRPMLRGGEITQNCSILKYQKKSIGGVFKPSLNSLLIQRCISASDPRWTVWSTFPQEPQHRRVLHRSYNHHQHQHHQWSYNHHHPPAPTAPVGGPTFWHCIAMK